MTHGTGSGISAKLPGAFPGADRLPSMPDAPAVVGERARTGRIIGSPAALWVVSRTAAFVALALFEYTVRNDVNYYWRSLNAMLAGTGLAQTLREYPVPVLATMLPQYAVSGGNRHVLLVVFAASMLAVDAWFTRFLYRAADSRWSPALVFWLCFVPSMGPMSYFRFDLIPAVLTGVALSTAAVRPARAGVLVAVGAALKLWPALLLPALLLERARRRPVVVGFVVAGTVLALASLIIGGTGRLVSPLRWQSGRGLQIESIAATPLMVARAFHPHGVWRVFNSRYKAYEIHGAAAHALITLSTVAQLAGFTFFVALWIRAFRAVPSVRLAGWTCLATVAVMTVTNKTLSPQYVLWLGGPVAVLLVQAPRDVLLRRFAAVLLVTAGLSQLIYPIAYNGLNDITPWLRPLSTTLLVLRNALMLWLTMAACVAAWRAARPATPVGVRPAPRNAGTQRRGATADPAAPK